eukprot:476359_1
MPKRKSTQNKKRKQKRDKGKASQHQSNNPNDNTNIDFDALIEQQINATSDDQSHASISQMLQNKIASIEQSQKRQENAALFKKNVILQQMNMMKQQYENKTNDDDEDTTKHRQELYKFITRVNDIFYDVLDTESNLKSQSKLIVQQNDTLKKLCKKLQEDKKILNQNLDDIQQREKNWRNEIEGKFQDSLKDIKTKIGDHEQRYNAVVDENKKLREQLQTFLDYDKKRSADFELYKEHQTKLDEIHDKEKSNFAQMVDKEKQQTLKLKNNLEQAIQINELLKARCNQYESKFGEMAKTVKESSNCIDEYKKMNIELMKQNKSLHGKLNDVMSKYRQLNSYNDQLDVKNAKGNKRIDTLSELCRKLQVKNKDLTEDLKMAKASLFNQGISLQFKSDVKTVVKRKEKKVKMEDADGGRNEEDDTDDGVQENEEDGDSNVVDDGSGVDNNEDVKAKEEVANENTEHVTNDEDKDKKEQSKERE